MDKTINKIIVGFLLLILLDTVSFKVEKTQFGMFKSVLNVVSTIKQAVNVIR